MSTRGMPEDTGYYWAKWCIAVDGTRDAEDLTPSKTWEIVVVTENPDGTGLERMFVDLHGIEMPQWRDCFFWGPKVAELRTPERSA